MANQFSDHFSLDGLNRQTPNQAYQAAAPGIGGSTLKVKRATIDGLGNSGGTATLSFFFTLPSSARIHRLDGSCDTGFDVGSLLFGWYIDSHEWRHAGAQAAVFGNMVAVHGQQDIAAGYPKQDILFGLGTTIADEDIGKQLWEWDEGATFDEDPAIIAVLGGFLLGTPTTWGVVNVWCEYTEV